jgi:hypothetical protein
MMMSQPFNIPLDLLENKMKQIPSFELSYETSSPHRKVPTETPEPESIGLFIPKSKKYLVWFTYVETHDVAILIELGRNKKPVQYKVLTDLAFDPHGPELAQGTILYGSQYVTPDGAITTFIIEDIVLYRSILLRKLCYGDRLGILYEIFRRDLLPGQHNEGAAYRFALPSAFPGSRDPTDQELVSVPYPVHHVQYRLFDRIVPYVNVLVQSRTSAALSAAAATPPAPPRIALHRPLPTPMARPPRREPRGKERDVFLVRADIPSDLYVLTHPKNLYDPDYAYIPNYRVSVFMNNLFRTIKENQNLDSMEDSDDEEELMDLRVDKYVDLKKEYRMECMYHKKFRRWIPLRVVFDAQRNLYNKTIL